MYAKGASFRSYLLFLHPMFCQVFLIFPLLHKKCPSFVETWVSLFARDLLAFKSEISINAQKEAINPSTAHVCSSHEGRKLQHEHVPFILWSKLPVRREVDTGMGAGRAPNG